MITITSNIIKLCWDCGGYPTAANCRGQVWGRCIDLKIGVQCVLVENLVFNVVLIETLVFNLPSLH